jgi:hypothetical protein
MGTLVQMQLLPIPPRLVRGTGLINMNFFLCLLEPILYKIFEIPEVVTPNCRATSPNGIPKSLTSCHQI